MSDEIRRVVVGDYDAYAAMFLELGVDDPTPSAERFASELARDILICERDGAPIGYVSYDRLAGNGFIRNLVVVREARGAGGGAQLMTAAAAQLRLRGATEDWHLNVKADNTAAIRLYERFGMHVDHCAAAVTAALPSTGTICQALKPWRRWRQRRPRG